MTNAPATAQVRIAIGADLTAVSDTWTWTDITDFVPAGSGITIQRGETESTDGRTDCADPPR